MNLFSNNVISKLETSLSYSAAKQRVISNNISNVDTPNYKAKSVSFKDEFHRQLQAKRTDVRHNEFISNSNQSYAIRSMNNTSYNHNGNNVDIDKEMAEMAKNQIYYDALVERLNGKFRGLQQAIKGGQ
ncbi:flagellar basal body rod protein FlgB [Bacillus solimangrovi]|uniref:Flagellar basal body rod protein FlgB n=1 Tax=Bacillus solimangrovi TaxID=1305675 RepID=A0A1E5LB00_9BACI|nr:flagellar basal body rod protein FlgB [Bacillus solimangrovi]OEH91255.1 flagellar basal body rod protein FlgB [Bacillus solimangrovi]